MGQSDQNHSSDDHATGGHQHGHVDNHQHGHANDQGVRGMLRYLRWAPQMWRSSINVAVVALVAPRAGERVLDLGAGVGAGIGPGTATGATVVAVEPTPFLRRVLTVRRAFRRARRRIEVVDGTAEHIPVPQATIDAAWAVNSMHHWTDQERAAGELRRVLAPAGRVVLVDESFDDPTHPDHDRFGSDGGPEHHGFTLVDGDRMGSLLLAAGFVDVEAGRRVIDGRPTIAITASVPR